MTSFTRELLLLRHGKSSWADASLEDRDRPLKGRGKRQAAAMGRFLAGRAWWPDRVLVSPSKRTRQTAKLVMRELAFDLDEVVFEARIYESGVAELLRVVAQTPNSVARLMLIGHNPGLELLARRLCGPQLVTPSDGKIMPTSAFVHMGLETSWQQIGQAKATLLAAVRPKDLESGNSRSSF